MIAAGNNIIVRVLMDQAEEAIIGGALLKTGRRYNENFREKSPVIANVVSGIGEIKTGSYIVCNYNYFDEDSAFLLYDDLFSIPLDQEIFAFVNEDGSLVPLFENLLVERVEQHSSLPLPDELKKPHYNQGTIFYPCEGFLKDQYILWLDFSDYQIVYFWNGEEKRYIKIHKSEVVAYLK